MPDVRGPGDGGYKYYNKPVEELEEELKTQAKRTRKNQEERVDQLERNYKADLRRQEQKMVETTAEIRKNMHDTLSRERELNRQEVERIKQQTYDKFGRYGGQEADVLQRQLEDSSAHWEAQHKKDSKALGDQQDAYDKKLESLNSTHSAEMERVAQEARSSASEAYARKYQGEEAEFAQRKKQSEEHYHKLSASNIEETNRDRRQIQNALGEMQADYSRRARKLEDSHELLTDKHLRESGKREIKNADSLRKSHDSETRELRGTIKDLVDAESHYIKSKAEGTRDAINEFEGEWRDRQTLMSEAYESQIDSLKASADEQERYQAQLQNRVIKEKDKYFAELIAKQNEENSSARKELEAAFQNQNDQMTLLHERDQRLSEQRREGQLKQANEQRELALRKQAESYQKSMADNRESAEMKINRLQAALRKSSTSDDVSLISPAAEASVRKSVVKEYEKAFATENERNQGTIDSMQKEYGKRLTDTVVDAQSRESELQQQNAFERNQERNDLLQHIQDVEFMKEETLRNQALDHDKQTENTRRGYTEMMERLRLQYEELLKNTKFDAQNKISALRQDYEFKAKMAHRTFSATQNELIRGYEKKLADQKAELLSVTKEAEAQADRRVRETERRHKIALEEQARGYEQRLTQLEYQQQERERYLTQSYQEDLEKMKQTNARLIQKKS